MERGRTHHMGIVMRHVLDACFSVLLGCLLLGGCGMGHYSTFVTLNERPKTIWIDEAWYGGQDWSGGIHEQYSSSSSGPLWPPYDTEAEFVWYDEEAPFTWNDGKAVYAKAIRQTVKIDPPIPDSFIGEIYFRFQPDGSIKVTPVTREEWSGLYGGDMSEKEVLRWKDRQGRAAE